MAWLENFNNRIKLTIPADSVDSSLTDFPVMINLSSSSGKTSFDSTDIFDALGDDHQKRFAITKNDGETQCPIEIEYWDATEEKAILWTKVPTVYSSVDTDLYFYWDTAASGNTPYVGDTGDTPAQNVWDSNFKLVMHMAQDPNGDVADAIKDSTSNTNHGTPGGSMTTADLVDGKIGKAIDFDGSNDYIGISTSNIILPTDSSHTGCVIVKMPNVTDAERRMFFESANNDYAMSLGWGNDNPGSGLGRINQFQSFTHISSGSVGKWVNSTTNPDADQWYLVHTVVDAGANKIYLYINGLSEVGAGSDNSLTGTVDNSAGLNIGTYRNANGRWAQGVLEEVRISDTARSAAWIKATYYSNWDGLVSFGYEETEAINYIAGYVKEHIIPITRQIYLHNRDTGALIGSTTSSGAGGYFYCETTYSGAHYVVCLDDEPGVNYNDLIYGNVFPATMSG